MSDALTSADYIKRLRAEAHATHGLGQLDWHWAAADRLEELEAIVTDLAEADPEQIPRTQLYLLRERARAAGVPATGDDPS